MNINFDPTIQSLDKSQKARETEKSTGDFARTLSEVTNRSVGKTTETAKTTAASSIMPTNPAAQILAANVRNQPQAQATRALDALDRYAEALADPNRSLKQIEPLVKDLENEAQNLQSVSKGLSSGDELKELIDQTAMLATVEAAKFRRGDYV